MSGSARFPSKHKKRELPPRVAPYFYVVGDSVTVQFAVDIRAAALGLASSDDDTERILLHQLRALQEGADEGLGNRGHLLRAAGKGEDLLQLAFAVLLLIENPFVYRHGETALKVLDLEALALGELINGLLVALIDVTHENLHCVPFLASAATLII